ncbi:MAG: hypothetical protein K2X82_34065, partial [Gemmataceae bacterium]|nr:hypothetical protein [Gemmataceae bacterium]
MDPITLDPPVKFPPVPAPRVVTPPAATPKPAEPPAAAASPPPGAAPAPKPGGSRKLLVGIAAAASLAGGVAGVRYFGPAADPGSAAADKPGHAHFAEEKARTEAEKIAKATATPGAADNGSARQPEQKAPATAPTPTWGTRSATAALADWPPDRDPVPVALYGGLYRTARDMAPPRPLWALPPAAPSYPSADPLAVAPVAAVPSA